jgi:hypothetical protein
MIRVVGGAALWIGQHLQGLVQQGRAPVVTPQVRVITKALHQGSITCPDDLYRRVRLDMQYPVIVATIDRLGHSRDIGGDKKQVKRSGRSMIGHPTACWTLSSGGDDSHA